MASLRKTIAHSLQTITAVKALIEIKALLFRSPLRAEIMSDLLPSDPKKREAYLINLYKYSRLQLGLKDGMVFNIADMETGSHIAMVHSGKVILPG